MIRCRSPLDNEAFASLDPVDPRRLRVGVTEDLGGVLVSASIRSTFRQRVDALADHVAECVEVGVDLRQASEIDWLLRSDVFVAQYHREAETWDEGFNPNIRRTYDSALATPMARHRYRPSHPDGPLPGRSKPCSTTSMW